MAELSFEDTEVAFRSRSKQSLEQAHWMFRMLQSPYLVNLGNLMAHTALKLGLPIRGIVKRTLFDQFCGGETIRECEAEVARLAEHGIGSILDHSVEGKEEESVFDAITEESVANIHKAAGDERIPFCVIKVTGIGRYSLLEKASSGEALTEKEDAELNKIRGRVHRLCHQAWEKGVRFFIDAEESWYQDIIDSMIREMMHEYNRERAIVFTTVQMYRRDRLDFLREEWNEAKEKGYHLGIKVVRGAYMEKERARAERKGYPDPIHPNKEATDQAHDDALRFCMDHLDTIALCAGTHNENSTFLLTQLMEEKGVDRNDERVWFAQLFGMSDNISFNLAQHGYNVAKYLPYGPVRDVLPYLIRRAQENTSVQGQSSRELALIEKELKRRREAG